MKTAYFTPANLADQAQALQLSIEHNRRSPHFDWRQAALLVLDMQLYFLDPGSHAYIPSAPTIIPNLQQLITAFTRRQRPVIFTRHLNTPENAGAMARWWRDLIRAENPASAISPQLETNGHPVIVKSQYDAFYQTNLETQLRNQMVRQVVVSGVMTNLCCETTARAAFGRGFDVLFTIDGTATYNEDFHRASLLNLAHGFATPILTRQILEAFDQNGS